MSLSFKQLNGFFNLATLTQPNGKLFTSGLNLLRREEINGILVKEVFSNNETAKLTERLETEDIPFIKTWFPKAFHAWFLGRNLNLESDELSGYFEQVPAFEEHLATLFHGDLNLESRLFGVLADLDQEVPFCAAPGPVGGQRYMVTTLRAHTEAGFIPVHCDNEQAVRPSFLHLRNIISTPILSFVLCLQNPVSGGELEVFARRAEGIPLAVEKESETINLGLEDVPSVKFSLSAGELIIINSGNYYHQLLPVDGNRKRWTVCSFFARSSDDKSNYCWG